MVVQRIGHGEMEHRGARIGGLRAFGVLFRRDLLNLFLNPAWIMFNTVFPLLLVLVLGYLTKGGSAPGHPSVS